MDSVFRAGLTRIANGNASRMSPKVISKGIISSTVSGLGGSLLNGLKSRAIDVWGTKPGSGTSGGPLYWEPAR